MIGKNNYKLYLEKDGEKVTRYSIKKFTVGTASVAVAASIFFGMGSVAHAAEVTEETTTNKVEVKQENNVSVNSNQNIQQTNSKLVVTEQPASNETAEKEVTSKEAVNKETTEKETTSEEAVNKEATKKETTSEKAINKETTEKKVASEETVNEEITHKKRGRKSLASEESSNKESVGTPEVDKKEETNKNVESNKEATEEVDKVMLEVAIKEATELQSAENVDEKSKNSLSNVIIEANSVLYKRNTDQNEVDDITNKVNNIIGKVLAKQLENKEIAKREEKEIDSDSDRDTRALPGVDVKGLKGWIATGDTVKNSEHYLNATPAQRSALDKALAEAKKVLADRSSNQTKTNNVTNALTQEVKKMQNVAKTNKGQLNNLINADAEFKETNAKYYNETDEAKVTAYNNAIAEGKTKATKAPISQTEVNAIVAKINEAKKALNGKPTDYSKLRELYNEIDNIKNSPQYYNADELAQGAYEANIDDVTAVIEGLDNGEDNHISQESLNELIKYTLESKGELTGRPTDKAELQKLATENKEENSKYYNADEAKKAAYDKEVEAAKQVLSKENATQKETDAAKAKLQAAKDALNGAETDKSKLQKLVELSNSDEVTKDPKYYNASKDALLNYYNAVKKAEETLAKPNATQTEIDKIKEEVEVAKNALDGKPTNYEELNKLIATQNTMHNDPKYFNASEAAKKEYDDAIEEAKKLASNPEAYQKNVDETVKNLKEIIEDLDGKATDKDALQKLVDESNSKNTNYKYYNASGGELIAYDEAVEEAKAVLAKANPTQAEIEEAKTKLEAAKNGLDGKPTNFEELQGYIDREEAVLNSHEFYNADPEKKALYEKRIKDAKALLTKENVTQSDVGEIESYLRYIVKSLDGKETDKTELSKLVKDLENKTKEDKYTKAEDSRKFVYDLAVEEAQKVLSKEKATQEEVNLAKKQLEAARDALNGDRIRREDLQSLVDESNSKDSNEKYYNADDDRKVAYDKAIEDVKELLSRENISQAEIDAAKEKIDAAKEALNGNQSTKEKLEILVNESNEKDSNSKYYNSDPEKKLAYDKAEEEAKKVLAKENVTQKEIDAAKAKLQEAKDALNGTETNAQELKKLIDEVTKVYNSSRSYNAAEEKQEAHYKAVEAAREVLLKENVTQAEVDAAKAKVLETDAALDGKDTDYSKFWPLHDEIDRVKNSPKYYNADESAKKQYDESTQFAKTQGDLKKRGYPLSQRELDGLIKFIEDSKAGLNGEDTNKALLQSLADESNTKDSNAKYYNAEAAKKTDYDKAVEEAKKVLTKENVTQKEIDAAKAKLQAAKDALNGDKTQKERLQVLADESNTKDSNSKYYNADAAKKAEYDKAVEAAKAVLAKENATQTEIDAAKEKLEAAKTALNGKDTNKAPLQSLADESNEKDYNPNYYNADTEKQDAYNEAIEEAKVVLAKENVTQAEINASKAKLEEAKKALNGKNTNIEELLELVKDSDMKNGYSYYYNADVDKKEAYDKAIEEANKVLSRDLATQAEVDAAKAKLQAAKDALNGDKTNTEILQSLADESKTKDSNSKYYNADADKQSAYNKAVEDAKAVLAKENVSQEEVDAVKAKLQAAKNALNGADTNKEVLQNLADESATKDANAKYYNADADKQAVYNKAVENAKAVLTKENVTQAEVDAAKAKLQEAKDALNGADTNKEALQNLADESST
ncbi:YSIRK-type signal peptide-containing protein, partial [Gemella sanguinis]|uniref:YSIRK-type signal peptide-containing protein n=1 Tax=Gemella sanguinis TaxID=84135 RepID=UPI00352F7D9F